MTNEELIKELREVTGGKLSSTNTPNHLRLAAADRIEQLSLNNDAMLVLVAKMSNALYDCIIEKRQLEKEIREINHV